MKKFFALGLTTLFVCLLAVEVSNAQFRRGRRVVRQPVSTNNAIVNETAELSTAEPTPAPVQSASLEVISGEKVMSVFSEKFGETKEGQKVTCYTLNNGNGIVMKVLDFGGVIYSLETPDKDGNSANISCNLATVAEYQDNKPFFGSLIGRYGNRIAKGKFSIDGQEYTLAVNNGENALHGGLKGFDQVIWKVTPFGKEGVVGLNLEYNAKDGEEGYPGNLNVKVVYSLTDKNVLTMDYTATTDKKTPVNLTNHTFWNLAGAYSGSVLDQEVRLGADRYLPTDEGLIPTGEIASVEGTPLDFTETKKIGQDNAKITEPQFLGGYDHCLILKDKPEGEMGFCAFIHDPKTGRTMEIQTTEPAVQFYTGNFLDESTGMGDYKYPKHGAFCLETQHYPDSPNQPSFPNTILEPGKVYKHTTVHTFGVQK